MLKIAYQLGVELAVKEAALGKVVRTVAGSPLRGALTGSVVGAGIGSSLPDADYKSMLLSALGGAATGALGGHGYEYLRKRRLRNAIKELFDLTEKLQKMPS